jgi:hypothetical protein
VAWAEPYAYGIMALDEERFERISSTRVFMLMLRGAIRRYELLVDLFGAVRVDTLVAGGVTFSDTPGPPRKNAPTFERLMGRLPVPLVDPPPKTPAEIAAEEEQAKMAAGKLALAQAQLWEAGFRATHPDRVVDAPGETEPSPPA